MALNISQHFRQVSTRRGGPGAGTASPKPPGQSRLFTHQWGSDNNLAQQVQQLAHEVGLQGQTIGEIASAVSGSGTSVLGGLAGSLAGGFSWQSLLKDVLPLGGLASEIAGLFRSPAPAPMLQQYDAPVSLNFSGVLGTNGGIQQVAGDAVGLGRTTGTGLDLLDAAGGPRQAYTRMTNGLLGETAGTPVSRYSGTLDLSQSVQALAAAGPAAQVAAPVTAQQIAATAAAAGNTPDSPGVPTFDGPWFMDHAPYIAAAVRNAMLNSHPIVDVVNDL
jgi:hypothetical protein